MSIATRYNIISEASLYYRKTDIFASHQKDNWWTGGPFYLVTNCPTQKIMEFTVSKLNIKKNESKKSREVGGNDPPPPPPLIDQG